jgi:uncharacterized membrane protein
MTEYARGDVLVALIAMMAVTVAVRLGGFWLMRYIPLTPRVRRMLDALPGSIVVAASLPVVVSGGGVVAIAIVAAVAATIVRRSEFVAVITAMAVAALVRAVGFN